MMARYLQEKLEEIWNENITKDSKVSKLKAVSAASASGAIDGAVLMYPYLLICCCIAQHNLRKLNK